MLEEKPSMFSIYADFFRMRFKKTIPNASDETHEYMYTRLLETGQCIFHFRKKGKSEYVRITVNPWYYCNTSNVKKFKICVFENQSETFSEETDEFDILLRVFEFLTIAVCK